MSRRIVVTIYQRSRLDKCGSCDALFRLTAGPARTHFHYLTLHGTRPLNICSRCSATNHVFRLSITWFSVFLKVTFVRIGVSGNGNACAQVPAIRPKKCTRFAIGLMQQLPHLSNLLLCSRVSKNWRKDDLDAGQLELACGHMSVELSPRKTAGRRCV